MVVGTSHDALQRCEQVRKLWDSMKIQLAKERKQLDYALAKVMEAKQYDEQDDDKWRERRNESRQALVAFVQRAQTEWRWRLHVAKLQESDWTSGNITEKERAVVEAIMAMPRYIDEEEEVSPPTRPMPVKRSISSLPSHERVHGPPLKRSVTAPISPTLPRHPVSSSNAKASSSKVTLEDEIEEEALHFSELPRVTDEQRLHLRTRGFFTYVQNVREWAEEEAQRRLEAMRREVFGDVPDTEMELEALTDMHLVVFQGVYQEARILLQDTYRQYLAEYTTQKEPPSHINKDQLRFEDIPHHVRVVTRNAMESQQRQLETNFLSNITKPDLSERDRARMRVEYERRRKERESRIEQEIGRKIAVAAEKWLMESAEIRDVAEERGQITTSPAVTSRKDVDGPKKVRFE